MNTENMKLYNELRAVPDEAKKPITGGRLKGMTDINPMWRIKRLTEVFGPCGFGWWYEISDEHIYTDDVTKQACCFVDIRLYVKDPTSGEISHAIPGSGGASLVAQEKSGAYLSDEGFKMALTDAISIAAKALGLGADVWFAAGRDKYTAQNATPKEQQAAPKAVTSPPQRKNENGLECEDCHGPISDAEWKFSERVYNGHFCRECQNKRKKK